MEKFNSERIYKMTIENGGHTAGQIGRFMVALKGYEKFVELEFFKKESIDSYIKQVFPENVENATIGTWIDRETGLVYLDTSVAYDDKTEAINAGLENEQIAIYDIVEQKSIYLREYK